MSLLYEKADIYHISISVHPIS